MLSGKRIGENILQEHKKELLDWCIKEREESLKSIKAYQTGGMTFHVRHGSGPMEDVTAEQLASAKRIVADMDDLISKLEAENANRT